MPVNDRSVTWISNRFAEPGFPQKRIQIHIEPSCIAVIAAGELVHISHPMYGPGYVIEVF